MLFSLDVIRARKGDCLMLHYGTKKDPRLIMIDGGPAGVYGPHLKPRIKHIRKVRKIDERKPLPVDVLLISHVDDDHIRGILDLTKEMITAEMEHKPQLVRISTLWHNSFENMIEGSAEDLTASFQKQFGAASAEGELPQDVTIDADDEDLDEEEITWNLKALASVVQGARLRSDAERLAIELNLDFDGELIVAEEGAEPITLEPGVTMTVIGPMLPELKKLHKKHVDWLKELKKKGKTPEEALAAYVDKSVPNLSSIVLLVEAGPDNAKKRMLLTGDARGDKILEGMELIGLVEEGGRLDVDVLKVPHHGSDNNLGDDFFQRVVARHYVFSGDGEHGNPERESLRMLLDARGNEDYEIHLTYPIDEIDEARQDDWEKARAKEQKKKKKNPTKKVRPKWSHVKHSMSAFFDDNPEFAEKVRIVDADKPHLIDLLDEVGLALND